MFGWLGVLLAIYIGYAAWSGEVLAKSGPVGLRVRRDDDAPKFWSVLACYALLGAALMFWF